MFSAPDMVWTWHACSSACRVLSHWCHTVCSVDFSTIQMQSLINLLIFGIALLKVAGFTQYISWQTSASVQSPEQDKLVLQFTMHGKTTMNNIIIA